METMIQNAPRQAQWIEVEVMQPNPAVTLEELAKRAVAEQQEAIAELFSVPVSRKPRAPHDED